TFCCNHVCQSALKPNGAACTQDNQCCSSNCFNGVCADRVTACGTEFCSPSAKGCAGNTCCFQEAFGCAGNEVCCNHPCCSSDEICCDHACCGDTCCPLDNQHVCCGGNRCCSSPFLTCCNDGTCCDHACCGNT